MDLEQCDWTIRLRPAKRYLLGFILGALALAPSVFGQAPGPDSSIVSPPNIPSGSTGGIKPSQVADDTFFEILFSGGPLGVGINDRSDFDVDLGDVLGDRSMVDLATQGSYAK